MVDSFATSGELRGVGLGLRAQHYQDILQGEPDVPWFEALTDNYMEPGGLPLFHLREVAKRYPVTFHGVGLSLGSVDPLDEAYLQRLRALVNDFQPVKVSDHLCWSSVNGIHGNDLFPLPYSPQALDHIVSRIEQVQDFLGRQILVENVSSYLTYQSDCMTEWEFVSEVVNRSGCGLLCDVNNIYVSAKNHQFDPIMYLQSLPKDAIQELHLAGFEDMGTHLLDTHGASIHEGVWCLYRQAIELYGPLPTLIEWDTNIPSFEVLLHEAQKAERILVNDLPSRQRSPLSECR
ncbi:hypothetical protein OLMES_4203 [Oleiphilus messinensis]|uniref:UPF0276 protein OLMES_4203 n=1 Tax=Oleiphilus messinensis TaxID=141451 RepID=A0A1Y0IDI3_9GAMM|nr:DUF692 domain-containing protein [Oleiphilus messinensis]ARU58219.1 hypothetical protein OLMES_4203 [Oleiphilus messinensis]